MTSTARIEANRRNAKSSTGPRTEAGKARSRWNALRHGLRAEQAVMPTEDAGEFAAHLGAWVDDWRPPTQARLLLVERAATASWRLRRCVRVEGSRLSRRVHEAYGRWDGMQERAAGKAFDRLRDEPIQAVEELEQTRPGLIRLIGIWETIADALAEPGGWVEEFRHHHDFVDLWAAVHDPDEDDYEADEDASWRLLLHDHPRQFDPHHREPLDDEEAEVCRARFAEVARVHLDRLVGLLDAMPEDTAARRRFAEVEATTPRAEDAALLRYEAHFDRQARACIAQLAMLQRTGADLVEGGGEAIPGFEGTVESEPTGGSLSTSTGFIPTSPPHPNPPPQGGRGVSEPSPLEGEGWVGGGVEAGETATTCVARSVVPTEAGASPAGGDDVNTPATPEPPAPNEPNAIPVGKAGRDRRGRAWPAAAVLGVPETPRS